MSRQDVLTAARAVVTWWRERRPLEPGVPTSRPIWISDDAIEEIEVLCRAVDDLPAEPQRWRDVRAGVLSAETLARIDADVAAEAARLCPPVTRQMDRFDTLLRLNEERERTLARIETIADEACGPWPLSTADQNLNRIEGELLRLRKESRQGAALVRALIRAAGVEADVEDGRDPVDAVRSARDQAREDADVVAGLANRARNADEARDALKLQVTEFFNLWDRSEEEDPPDLGPAAVALRAAAGLAPEAELEEVSCEDCGGTGRNPVDGTTACHTCNGTGAGGS